MNNIFPSDIEIKVYDPLAKFLGAGDGHFSYSFADVVKLSGHACPTVAGAFLMADHALKALYGQEVPQRGNISIAIQGSPQQGVTGPISQVFTLITGAAGTNGFAGLAGRFRRSGLINFIAEAEQLPPFIFERLDTGAKVGVSFDAVSIASEPSMGRDLQRILEGDESPARHDSFSSAWRARVLAILKDGGASTVTLFKIS